MTIMVGMRFDIYKLFNGFFKKEFVGYRFVNRRIVAITDENEIDSIENACNSKYVGCILISCSVFINFLIAENE